MLPDEGRRLLVIGSTLRPHLLEDLGLVRALDIAQSFPLLDEPSQGVEVLPVDAHMNELDARAVAKSNGKPIGMKQLLMVAEMANQAGIRERTIRSEHVFEMPDDYGIGRGSGDDRFILNL